MPATLDIPNAPDPNRLALRRPGIRRAVTLRDAQEIAPQDAIRGCAAPVVEAQPSNVFGREAFGHHWRISSVAKDLIRGFGPVSYLPTIDALAGLPPGA